MNFETARVNMIEQQIRPWNVLQMQTLNALAEVRREDFVPEAHRNLAFADVQIPIDNDQVMLEPKVGARMVEALGLSNNNDLLQIGSGTGYLTALAASLCQSVTAIEIHSDLASAARRNLSMAGFSNTQIVEGDCFDYFTNGADSFDNILITGSIRIIPATLFEALNPGGSIVGVIGSNPAMQAVSLSADGACRNLFETSIPRLENVVEQTAFAF